MTNYYSDHTKFPRWKETWRYASGVMILISVLVFGLTVFITHPADAANKNEELTKCEDTEDEITEIACLEKLLLLLGIRNRLTTPKPKWRVHRYTNPIDDSDTVQLILTAVSGTNTFNEKIVMNVRCTNNKTYLIFNWESYMVYPSYTRIRLGSDKAVDYKLSVSDNNHATYHKEPIPLLKSMFGSNRIIVQAKPYNGNEITAVFDVSGLEQSIKPVRKECGW